MKSFFCITALLILFSCSIRANDSIRNARAEKLIREIEHTQNDKLKIEKIMELTETLLYINEDKLNYMEKGLQLAEKNNMQEEIGLFYYDMAWYYLFHGDKEKVLDCLKKVTEFTTDPEILVYAYGLLSNQYAKAGKTDLALQMAEKACDVANNDSKKTAIADAYMFLGDAYRYRGDTTRAKLYYLKAFNDFTTPNKSSWSILYIIANIYVGDTSFLAEENAIFRSTMGAKKSYEESSSRRKQMFVYHIMNVANSSVFSTENIEIQTLQLKSQRNQLILFIVLIIFLLVIATLLIIQVQVKRKANKKLKMANEIKSRLFVVLNHDLRQPVASLVSYLEFRINNPEAMSPEEILSFDKKTKNTANRLLMNMENLLIWAKDQMQLFELDFQLVSVPKLYEKLRDFFTYEENVVIKFSSSENLQIRTDENYIVTIMRNLTMNAIKASQGIDNPVVIWKAWKEGKNIILTIENFGEKISQENIDIVLSDAKQQISPNGAGLVIVRDLAKAIGCKIEIETGEKFGTTFKLIF